MPFPVSDEIRRARHDDPEDEQEDYWEEVRKSAEDVWEDLTTLPTVVTIMGAPFTLDSTGLPSWMSLSTDDLPDALKSRLQSTTSAQPTAVSSTLIPISKTSVTVTPATELGNPGAHVGSSATHGAPSSTSAPGQAGSSASAASSTSAEQDHDSGPPLGLILAGVIIPVLVISLLAFTAFVVMRRRRQKRDAERAMAADEMKFRHSDDSQQPPFVQQPPVQEPPAIREPSPQDSPRAVTPVPAPPPVIVSAMNPANNSSYFTGIDTSEALSVRTNSVRSGQRPAGFMLDGEFHEEPPPPYRPRSVPPISRGSSMRTNYRADYASSQPLHDHTRVVNPFADPSDDDNVSIMSGPPMNPFAREADDHLSVVSDMSYQHEPATVHQSV
ncbi:uncharacterized protein LTHEOB_2378 [Lasiodiplodia theobromae]|uniref:uncharacterized protein n=1 Tax=Lasiodiplodia theobromae TaxID=45133 RepID=UPI0015C33941|nr:uncharacterized protein LTHEOB_2378 [Lasiodiplodia theobromae]KAF4535386.1 hypothetical protein LTHEOB_2378 [Lasiodiplodia theobromae]